MAKPQLGGVASAIKEGQKGKDSIALTVRLRGVKSIEQRFKPPT